MWPYDVFKTALPGGPADGGRAQNGYRITPAEYAMMARGESVATATLAIGTALARTIDRFIVKPLRTWRKRRATYDELMALDDHMLRDLGVTRGQIASVALTVATGDQRVRAMTVGEIANRNEASKAA